LAGGPMPPSTVMARSRDSLEPSSLAMRINAGTALCAFVPRRANAKPGLVGWGQAYTKCVF
jgi:hypothetical protein